MKTVILAGGSGSRLWPLSNDDTPKQLLSIDGKFTLLQNTFCRAQQFSAAADILTVTNVRFRDKTVAQLQEIAPGSPVLCEPCGRNTAPAIGCALKYLLDRGGDDVVAILPADHLIQHNENFSRTIRAAAELAESGFIVTLGIKPDYPERVTNPEAKGLRHLAFHVENVEPVVQWLNSMGIETEPIRVDEFTNKKMTPS